LLPAEKEEGGWSSAGTGEASGDAAELGSLRGKIEERVREMCWRERKGVGGRRGGEVHQRCRI
jgi:hypothetical protein